jgi:hypothetical protein
MNNMPLKIYISELMGRHLVTHPEYNPILVRADIIPNAEQSVPYYSESYVNELKKQIKQLPRRNEWIRYQNSLSKHLKKLMLC